MTEPIKLPPLPEWMYGYTIPNDGFDHSQDDIILADRMRQYARAAIEADRQARNCGQCVPLSTDGKSVFIDGVGDVPLDFSGQTMRENHTPLMKEAALHLTNWLDKDECECEGPGHQCGRTQVERCRDRLLAAAPQPVQPVKEETDDLGIPKSCGKPFCAPNDHHPLCDKAEPVKPDSAGYTLGPVSDGGFDPRNANDRQARGEPVAWISDSPTKGNGRRLFWTKADAWRWSSNIKPLYTTPQIPEGYKLVPIEPTDRMLRAAYHAVESEAVITTVWLRKTVYKAMLEAAPQPTNQESE